MILFFCRWWLPLTINVRTEELRFWNTNCYWYFFVGGKTAQMSWGISQGLQQMAGITFESIRRDTNCLTWATSLKKQHAAAFGCFAFALADVFWLLWAQHWFVSVLNRWFLQVLLPRFEIFWNPELVMEPLGFTLHQVTKLIADIWKQTLREHYVRKAWNRRQLPPLQLARPENVYLQFSPSWVLQHPCTLKFESHQMSYPTTRRSLSCALVWFGPCDSGSPTSWTRVWLKCRVQGPGQVFWQRCESTCLTRFLENCKTSCGCLAVVYWCILWLPFPMLYVPSCISNVAHCVAFASGPWAHQ